MSPQPAPEPQVAGCPPPELLEASAVSGTPDEHLRNHLDRCEHCLLLFKRIREDNSLLAEFVAANSDRLSDPPVQPKITGYESLREIRRGGQGVVYRAVQTATHRPVAIKMLHAGSFATTSQRRRFEREAEIAARLRHPNIVTVYDSGRTAGGHHYLAMEYIDGVPLDEYMRGVDATTTRGIRLALALFTAICEAAVAAHQRGVIHRDLKPGNILVDSDGTPRVLDFGLALHAQGSEWCVDATRTATGEFRGTLAYAAPEQIAGNPDAIDVRSDVYALGVILYEMLTGVRPHRPRDGGEGEGVAQMIRSILHEPPADPRSINRAVDDEVGTIVLKAMAKDPSRRYRSAAALLDDVRHYLAGEAINAKRDSRWYLLRKTVARHRLAASATAALALFLLGFGAVMTVLYQRAVAAEMAAEASERDLKQVVEFQEMQISEIDVPAMAIGLRLDLLERTRGVLNERGRTPQQIDDAMTDLERIIAGVNFTDAALKVLHDNIFERALSSIDKQFADQPRIRARLLETLAITMRDLGLLERAKVLQDEALAIRRRTLGDEHPETLTSVNNTGVMLQEQGNLREAELYYREALETRRRVLGNEHPDTLASVSNMGALLRNQGKLQEAEPYYREALEGFRRILGDEHPETLTSVNNMGDLLRSQGKLEEAEPYYREALEVRRRTLGEEHHHTLQSSGNLEILLRTQGKLEEAEHYLRETLEVRRRILGDTHPDTLRSLNNMGVLLHGQGKPEEAEHYFREVLETRRRVLGNEHPDTLASVNNMGALLRNQGKLEEAEPYYREALEGFRRILGDEHPETLTSVNNMGNLLRSQGKLEEAEPYYREALEVRRRTLGDEHSNTLTSVNGMGVLLAIQGKLEEAEHYFREVLETRRRVLGNEHPDTLTSVNNMGVLMRNQGKPEEAEPYYREALEVRWRTLGDEHPDTLHSVNNLAALLRQQGKLDEAAEMSAQATKTAVRIMPDRWETGEFLIEYTRTLAALGRFVEAEECAVEAYGIFESTLGAEHSRAVRVIRELADLYDARHAAEPDAGYDDKAAEWRAKLKNE